MSQEDNLTSQIKNNWVIVLILLLIVLGAVFIGIRIGGRQSPASSIQPQPATSSADQAETQSNWQSYENSQYNISFKYPPEWSVNSSTQAFEKGDLVAVQFTGVTQEPQTELSDGARFVVMIPQPTSLDLDSWVNNAHQGTISGDPPQISDTEINGVPFKKVYECGLGCFTYYYTITGGQVYGFMVSAAGSQEVELNTTIDQILKTLELTG